MRIDLHRPDLRSRVEEKFVKELINSRIVGSKLATISLFEITSKEARGGYLEESFENMGNYITLSMQMSNCGVDIRMGRKNRYIYNRKVIARKS